MDAPTLTDDQLRYLHLVACDVIDDLSRSYDSCRAERDAIWAVLTPGQRNELNRVTEAVFGKWV